LTEGIDTELRIELMDWDGNVKTANYHNFRVGYRSGGYELTVGNYSGNAGYTDHKRIRFLISDLNL